jgi:hypothetical protein
MSERMVALKVHQNLIGWLLRHHQGKPGRPPQSLETSPLPGCEKWDWESMPDNRHSVLWKWNTQGISSQRRALSHNLRKYRRYS